jgi:hypothetical protein
MPRKGVVLSLKIFQNLFDLTEKLLILQLSKMSDGVTGNTSDFGSEESRFETWSDNSKPLLTEGFFVLIN